ncbi:MAG: tetratricopeptide repeat protein [Byssovorax sp.]
MRSPNHAGKRSAGAAAAPWIRAAAPVALAAAFHLALPAAAFAQPKPKGNSTTSLIQRGGALFEDQQYEESIQTLSAALVRPGSTEAEKIETYRLLAYNYIILKRTEEADAAVRGILVQSENFSLPPTESPRFRDFFEATKKKWIDEGKPGKPKAAVPVVDKPVKIAHASPAEAIMDATIKLTGSVEDPDGRVRGVQLAYRAGTSGKFTTVAGTYALGEFRTQIPGTAVKPPLMEYYLQAVDKGGLPIATRGDVTAPLRVVVPAPSSVVKSPFLWVPVGLAVVGGAVAAAYFLTRPGAEGPGPQSTSTVTIRIKE